LFKGDAAVLTSGAVARYQEWKRGNPAAAAEYLSASNRAVAGFAQAGGWEEGAARFEAARALALELGRAIGVSGEVLPPAGSRGLHKAVGAGNELGVLVGAAHANLPALVIASRGLQVGEPA
jgi:hypothetical protein